MIAQTGNHPRETAPRQLRIGTGAEENPGRPFEQLLADLGAADAGFLGAPVAGLPPVQSSEEQAHTAEMFNERGLFAHSGQAGASVRAGREEPGSRPAEGADGEAAPQSASASTSPSAPPEVTDAVLPADLGSLRAQPAPELVAPVCLLPASTIGDPAEGGGGADGLKALTTQRPTASLEAVRASPGSAARLENSGEAEAPPAPLRASTSLTQPQAASRAAVTLGTTSAGMTVAARTPELTAEERVRLERRIAGELARHGLVIGRINLSAPAATRGRTEGE